MPTKLEEQITERVIAARKDAGLERKNLAEALVIDVNSYGHYERGRYAFTVDQLFTLSRVLGRSVEWFLGLETELTDREDHLLTIYRGLTPGAAGLLLDMAETFAKSERERGGEK